MTSLEWLPISELAPPWCTENLLVVKHFAESPVRMLQKLKRKYGDNTDEIVSRMALLERSANDFFAVILWAFKEELGIRHPSFRLKNAKTFKTRGLFFHQIMLLCKDIHHNCLGQDYRNSSHWWCEILLEQIKIDEELILSGDIGKRKFCDDNRKCIDNLRFWEMPMGTPHHLKALFTGCFLLHESHKTFEKNRWKPFLRSYRAANDEPSINGIVIKNGQVYRRVGKGTTQIAALYERTVLWRGKI